MKRVILMIVPTLIYGAILWLTPSCNKEQEELLETLILRDKEKAIVYMNKCNIWLFDFIKGL